MEKASVSVKIYNSTYALTTSASEEQVLKIAAEVDRRMQELAESKKLLQTDKIAIWTALDLAADRLELQEKCVALKQEMQQQSVAAEQKMQEKCAAMEQELQQKCAAAEQKMQEKYDALSGDRVKLEIEKEKLSRQCDWLKKLVNKMEDI